MADACRSYISDAPVSCKQAV